MHALAMSDSLWSMDHSPPGSYVHGISQARILKWIATPSSRGSSPLGDRTLISCIAGRFFTAKQSSHRGSPYVGRTVAIKRNKKIEIGTKRPWNVRLKEFVNFFCNLLAGDRVKSQIFHSFWQMLSGFLCGNWQADPKIYV